MLKCHVCNELEATRDGGLVGPICGETLCWWHASKEEWDYQRYLNQGERVMYPYRTSQDMQGRCITFLRYAEALAFRTGRQADVSRIRPVYHWQDPDRILGYEVTLYNWEDRACVS